MDFLELARERYSVRKFTKQPIEKEKLDSILKAGLLAPTACNKQPQRVLVITGDDALARLRKCTACHFDAPAAMLVCYDKDECWKREFDGKNSGDVDASIVTTHMMLEAAQLGIGTTWVMYFIPEAVRVELEVPDNLEPVALLVMGYPAPDAKPAPAHTQTKAIEDIAYYDSFN